MIAVCPKCPARYRVDAGRVSPEGVRLRCAKCRAVFRVRVPEALRAAPATASVQSAPAPPVSAGPQPEAKAGVDRERLIVVADPDVASGKRTMSTLAAWGLQPILVHDGVEALLTIQRLLPPVAVLDAGLPSMHGSEVCEMVKRNSSLRSMKLVLVGSRDHQDRHGRPPSEFYGADVYLEKAEFPERLRPVLRRLGYSIAASPAATAPQAAPAPEPAAAAQPIARPRQPVVPAPVAAAPESNELVALRANAERLARIIVSDILLYHPEQVEAGLASGRLAEALNAAIEEGRGFFAQRVDPRVRDERDYIVEEVQRVAAERTGG